MQSLSSKEIIQKQREDRRHRVNSLREQGFTRRQIAKALEMTVNQVDYVGKSEDYLRQRARLKKQESRYRAYNPKEYFRRRIWRIKTITPPTIDFTFQEAWEKLGENPVCYLTGVLLDLSNPRGYEIDHVLAVTNGGSGNLSNLRLALPVANRMKHVFALNDFIHICRQITNHWQDHVFKGEINPNPAV